mmetsp:Transcript_2438/g.6906  ORF Transcript_2438/g.6906 Transcript_2438/m.6906 type:complete len:230 (-) Transcript_2438:299-988(-)
MKRHQHQPGDAQQPAAQQEGRVGTSRERPPGIRGLLAHQLHGRGQDRAGDERPDGHEDGLDGQGDAGGAHAGVRGGGQAHEGGDAGEGQLVGELLEGGHDDEEGKRDRHGLHDGVLGELGDLRVEQTDPRREHVEDDEDQQGDAQRPEVACPLQHKRDEVHLQADQGDAEHAPDLSDGLRRPLQAATRDGENTPYRVELLGHDDGGDRYALHRRHHEEAAAPEDALRGP